MRIASINGVQYNNVSSALKTNLDTRTEQNKLGQNSAEVNHDVAFGAVGSGKGFRTFSLISLLVLGVAFAKKCLKTHIPLSKPEIEKLSNDLNRKCFVKRITDKNGNIWEPDTTNAHGSLFEDGVFRTYWDMINKTTGEVEKDAVMKYSTMNEMCGGISINSNRLKDGDVILDGDAFKN